MSPQGGRQASGKGRGSASGPAAARRLGLLVFGVAFLLLFVIVAIAEGLGEPSIPSDDVILVEEVPGDAGHVTKEEFDHSLELAARQLGQNKPPKPGDDKYEEVKEAALTALLEPVWVEGLAAEMGIEATDAEVAKELEKIKKENFPKEAEFQKFIKDSGFTPEDIDARVRSQILSTEIQQRLQADSPEPSRGEIEDYYEAGKATQFTEPPSLSVRLIVNKDRKKAVQALTQLEKANTAKDWNKAAKRFSEDPGTKDKGGLQENVAEETLEEPLNAAVFAAAEGQLEGPIKAQNGFYVFEVQSSTPEKTQDLKEVEEQIKSQMVQEAQQEYFNAFLGNFNTLWTSRTFCADGYVSARCANFEGGGRPESAPAACYEEDPDGGRPEACPAPVFQLIPAMPGSITPLAPKGTPLAQRPRPTGGGQVEVPAGLPEGVVPAPPSE